MWAAPLSGRGSAEVALGMHHHPSNPLLPLPLPPRGVDKPSVLLIRTAASSVVSPRYPLYCRMIYRGNIEKWPPSTTDPEIHNI